MGVFYVNKVTNTNRGIDTLDLFSSLPIQFDYQFINSCASSSILGDMWMLLDLCGLLPVGCLLCKPSRNHKPRIDALDLFINSCASGNSDSCFGFLNLHSLFTNSVPVEYQFTLSTNSCDPWEYGLPIQLTLGVPFQLPLGDSILVCVRYKYTAMKLFLTGCGVR